MNDYTRELLSSIKDKLDSNIFNLSKPILEADYKKYNKMYKFFTTVHKIRVKEYGTCEVEYNLNKTPNGYIYINTNSPIYSELSCIWTPNKFFNRSCFKLDMSEYMIELIVRYCNIASKYIISDCRLYVVRVLNKNLLQLSLSYSDIKNYRKQEGNKSIELIGADVLGDYSIEDYVKRKGLVLNG